MPNLAEGLTTIIILPFVHPPFPLPTPFLPPTHPLSFPSRPFSHHPFAFLHCCCRDMIPSYLLRMNCLPSYKCPLCLHKLLVPPSLPFLHSSIPNLQRSFGFCRDDIPSYWLWMNYLSTFKYPLQMLSLNEFDALPGTCWQAVPPAPATLSPPAKASALAAVNASGGGNSSTGQSVLPGCAVTSADVLVSFSMSDASFWMSAAVMLSFFVGYRLLFLLTLKLQRTQRK